jgi:streptogrisin D
MQQRRPPLGAMLVGLVALLAGWSMAALAGTGGDSGSPGGDASPRDVPLVVEPPGGPPPEAPPPRPPAAAPRQPKATEPRRAAKATAPQGRSPATTTPPARTAKPAAQSAPAPTPAAPAAPPAPPTTVPPARPAPPTTVPAPTAPPLPPPGAPADPPSPGAQCNVPQDRPPWAEQAELLDLVEATRGVLDEVGSAGFAGFVVTPERCRLDLYWVGAPPPAVTEVVRGDRRVVVHDDADHDHAELSRAAETLAPGSPVERSAGVEVTSVAIPPEGTGLRVGVDAEGRSIDVRAAAAKLSTDVGVPVRVVIEGPSRPFGRIDDRAPWSAGGRAMVRVNGRDAERWSACSLGYGLRDPRSTREYAVTAAHCFDEAADAIAWNGGRRAPIGALGAMSLQLDVAYVVVDEPTGPGTSAHVWSGGVSDRQQGVRTVTGSSPTVKGMWVCGSGAATGENCRIKVGDVDVMQRATLPRSGATYTVRHTARGYRTDRGVASGSGDSGGPVFAPSGPGRDGAHAVGVIHGGVDGARVDCGDLAATECSASVIFVPVAEIQRWIGGELRIADGWEPPPGAPTAR